MSSSTAASILVLGRKSTTYSAPRYSSVCPFWRPKPLTSVTVIPCTPMADRASRTSSSLNGLMMAVMSFIGSSRMSERFGNRYHCSRLAHLLAAAGPVDRGVQVLVGIGADHGQADGRKAEVARDA